MRKGGHFRKSMSFIIGTFFGLDFESFSYIHNSLWWKDLKIDFKLSCKEFSKNVFSKKNQGLGGIYSVDCIGLVLFQFAGFCTTTMSFIYTELLIIAATICDIFGLSKQESSNSSFASTRPTLWLVYALDPDFTKLIPVPDPDWDW